MENATLPGAGNGARCAWSKVECESRKGDSRVGYHVEGTYVRGFISGDLCSRRQRSVNSG